MELAQHYIYTLLSRASANGTVTNDAVAERLEFAQEHGRDIAPGKAAQTNRFADDGTQQTCIATISARDRNDGLPVLRMAASSSESASPACATGARKRAPRVLQPPAV